MPEGRRAGCPVPPRGDRAPAPGSSRAAAAPSRRRAARSGRRERGAPSAASGSRSKRAAAISRTGTSIEKSGTSASPCWRSRLPSTSSRSVPSRSAAHGAPSVTASTASRLKSPAKTPRRTNIARASAPRRSMLHSTVAWMVRCRSGTSRAEVTRSGSTRSSRESIAAGVRARMRADASSMASGTPSSARQMRATSAAFSAVTSNRGSAARARSRKSRTAGDSRIASTVAWTGSGGTASGSTSKTCSPRTRSLARLVTRNVAPGRSVSSVTTSGAASSTCSKLSSTMRSRRPARAMPSCSESGRSPVSRTPSSRAIAREHVLGVAHVLERHERHPVERRAGVARDLDREAALADAAGADERDEPLRVVAQPGEQRRDLELAPHGLVVGGRDAAGRCRGSPVAVAHRAVDAAAAPARAGAGCVEPFGEQGGEVGGDQLGQFLGGRERRVRHAVVVADPCHELAEPVLAFGRRASRR